MSLKKTRRELLSAWSFQAFVLATGLVLAETVFYQQANYVYSSVVNLLLSVGIFFSISFGTLLAGWRPARRINDKWVPILTSVLMCAGFLGIIQLPDLGVAWVTIAFLGFGFFFARSFQRLSLKRLIVAIGCGSLLMYGSLHQAFRLGPQLILLSCAFPLLATLPYLYLKRIKLLLVSAIATMVLLLIDQQGLFVAKSHVHSNVPGLKSAEKVEPTHYSSLILTDLLWSKDEGRYFIITNGSKFSEVVGRENISPPGSVLPFFPSYDPPYLIHKPKDVLIIGPGGGANVRTALKWGVPHVTAVDINPRVHEIMTQQMRQHSQGLYLDSRLNFIASEGRFFLETTDQQFDLIVLQGVQTGSASNPLNSALLEGFLFTEESLQLMWKRLRPDGVLFIEEYVYFQDDRKRDWTLIDNLAQQLAQLIGESSARHILQFTFRQHSSNPASTELQRRRREFLIASKQPIPTAAETILSSWPKGLIRQKPSRELNDQASRVTDNQPYFIKLELLRHAPTLFSVSMLVLGIVFALIYWRTPSRDLRVDRAGVCLQGMGFIMFVMAILGPATLLIGPPQLSTPIVYSALFLFSTLGGLIALRRTNLMNCEQAYITTVGSLILVIGSYALLKDSVLSSTSIFLRSGVVTAVVGIAALAAEIPYILILNRHRRADRLWLFAIGKVGVFLGVPFGILAQVYWGYVGCIVLACLSYAIALLLDVATKKHPTIEASE
jgi:hypothetical protein